MPPCSTNKSNPNKKTKVIFFGTPDFSIPTLKALAEQPSLELGLVVTQPDKSAGRGGKLTAPPVKVVAEELGLAVIQPKSIRKHKEEFIKAIDPYQPFDIGIVIAFGQILPQWLLDLPSNGCVNLHASLLPRWRGAAPIQRALMSGDQTTGVSLMQMELKLDSGPVYSSIDIKIKPTDNFKSLHDTLAQVSADLITRDLNSIVNGKLEAIPQNESEVTYADKISNEECQIDWSLDASQINQKVKALNPIPGAFSTLQGKRIKIFEAEPKEALASSDGEPGSVALLDKAQLEISCGQGVLSLLEVQLEGKRKMKIGDFMRGVSLELGEKLG